MKRTALAFLVLAACHKREDAAARVDPAPTAPAATSATLVESPAPSETAAPSASAAASGSSAPLDPREARALALEQARSVGMIGLLSSGDGGSPWGREDSLGNMWGDQIGETFAGGVSRDGGPGGGTIGLGNIGTMGRPGNVQGGVGSHSPPRIRQGATTVNGRLPPEVIQRIVRQNFGRFRLCYEQGLRNNPKLSGTVATKFVIDKTGAVSSASRDSSTNLPDNGVVDCIVRGFGNLSFPQPEGGIVIVIYPVILDPPDSP